MGLTTSRADDLFVVDLERFQGPLDLLLHLIRRQDIDIFDIPIAKITAQFLRAVGRIEVADLDNAGEFLEMAATLIRIKAQVLLPRHGEDEEGDPRAELVRRLLEYEQIREISARLRVAEAERARRFSKGYVQPRPRPELRDEPLETTWDEVFEAALEVEHPLPKTHHLIGARRVAMEDKVTLILDTLRESAKVEFSRLLRGLSKAEGHMHGVMTFLASLELTRQRLVFMRQVKHFSSLWLYRASPQETEASPDGEGADPQQVPDAEASAEAPDDGIYEDAEGGQEPGAST